MERSPLQVVRDFFIGKEASFILNTKLMPDGRIIKWADEGTYLLFPEWTDRIDWKIKQEYSSDKIVNIYVKGTTWVFETLEGYTLRCRYRDQLTLADKKAAQPQTG